MWFLKKIGFRLLVTTIVFACIKLTVDTEFSLLSRGTLFYYLTAVFFFLFSWELNDFLIKKHLKTKPLSGLDWMSGLRITLITLGCSLPIFAMVYYFGNFTFASFLDLLPKKPWLQFRTDFFRAALLALTVCISNLYYFAGKVKKNLEGKMLVLEKELIASKYKSLKSQISPHFLFNSLNTLTALMYQDRDLASDFTARLASCYRYILDNREEDLVRLDKELTFLDSFIFMMDVRHKMSLKISMQIDLDASQYAIPTLSLQMLIENALKHNFYSTERPMLITISNTDKGILVENTLRERKENTQSTKLGLENIKKRFSYYTNESVKIKKENNVYSVLLPLLRSNVEQRVPLKIAP